MAIWNRSLVFSKDVLYIWNPYTKDYIQLPELPSFTSLDNRYKKYGFRYDSTADDYKEEPTFTKTTSGIKLRRVLCTGFDLWTARNQDLQLNAALKVMKQRRDDGIKMTNTNSRRCNLQYGPHQAAHQTLFQDSSALTNHGVVRSLVHNS
ncbi:hypothetical protein Sjap_000197 [Stephania japonica]|uniref:Uncharacterized protein n=1 Tax=Stephania japonica TaxID=461633 RepID=A0AAP0KJY6_9MAGN